MQVLTYILYGVAGGLTGLVFAGITAATYKVIKARRERKTPKDSYPVPEIIEVIDGMRYSSLDAKCISEGPIFLGWGWLMRSTHDNFFTILQTLSVVSITPVSQEHAIKIFSNVSKHHVPFEQAFPDVKIIDA